MDLFIMKIGKIVECKESKTAYVLLIQMELKTSNNIMNHSHE